MLYESHYSKGLPASPHCLSGCTRPGQSAHWHKLQYPAGDIFQQDLFEQENVEWDYSMTCQEKSAENER